eukprot:6253053-Amphidinium_carterae.1
METLGLDCEDAIHRPQKSRASAPARSSQAPHTSPCSASPPKLCVCAIASIMFVVEEPPHIPTNVKINPQKITDHLGSLLGEM